MAALVCRVRPDVQFLFAGDGELRRAMEAEVARMSLGQVVHLVGWHRDIAEIMRCLDVFVLTSLWEGLPRVYLEALASGVPVVGTRVDGAVEVVAEGVNGYLVGPGDMRAMADRVLSLLANPDERRRMGAQGQRLPAEFDIRSMVRQQEREYERLLADLVEKKSLRDAPSYGTPAKN
jgi:glycosyltransferase involved in cell wall biosynthesis